MKQKTCAGMAAAVLLGIGMAWTLTPLTGTAPLPLPATATARQADSVTPMPAARPAPPPTPAAVRLTDRVHEIESAVAQARARGADENDVYRLRAARLSAREIAMLDERERAERQWHERIAAWQTARAGVADDPGALHALRERMFAREEQGRLDAYVQPVTPALRFD